jgi:hypothetical protein
MAIETLIAGGAFERRGGSSSAAGTLLINVTDPLHGAKGDGVVDATAAFTSAWNAAIALGGRAAIYMPGGDYLITAALPIFEGLPIRVYGDGQGVTRVLWQPSAGANPACMTWRPAVGQLTLNFVEADHFSIVGSGATVKTGIRTIGTSYASHFHDLRIQMQGTGDTAHEIQGWDTTGITDVFYHATYPVRVKVVTYGAGAGQGVFDHFNFHNTFLFSWDDTQPLVSFENGVTVSNLSMTGQQAWVGGSDGLKFVSTGAFNFVKIDDVRWENGNTQLATPVLHGFLFDIQPSAGQEVTFTNCSGGSEGAQGWKMRNTQRITWNTCNFIGSWATPFSQFDVDNTCDKLVLNNLAIANAANASRTIGSQLIRTSSGRESATPGWYFTATYEKLNADENFNDVAVAGRQEYAKTITSLAAGASTTVASPGNLDVDGVTSYGLTRVFVSAEHATKSDATWEYGHFATVYFGISFIAGSANIATADVAGKLCVIWAGGTTDITIKNNLAVPVRIKVVID